MKERVAVTGANGYIGRRLVVAADAAGYEVSALLRDRNAAREWLPKGVSAQSWTLAQTTPKHLEGVSAVCHFAAFIPPDLADPAYAQRCVEDNALGTLRLLEAARSAGVRTFIYAGTAQVYGSGDRPATERDAISVGERAPYYLGSKLLGEIYCRGAEAAGHMRVVMLRLGSVYGPGMAARATLRRFIDDARGRRAIRLSNGGEYGADLVFVDDVVSAVLASLEKPVKGVYNIGSGVRTTMASLAAEITKSWGGSVEVEGTATGSAASRGFAPLDIAKATRDLGYRPTPLSAGLKSTAAE